MKIRRGLIFKRNGKRKSCYLASLSQLSLFSYRDAAKRVKGESCLPPPPHSIFASAANTEKRKGGEGGRYKGGMKKITAADETAAPPLHSTFPPFFPFSPPFHPTLPWETARKRGESLEERACLPPSGKPPGTTWEICRTSSSVFTCKGGKGYGAFMIQVFNFTRKILLVKLFRNHPLQYTHAGSSCPGVISRSNAYLR